MENPDDDALDLIAQWSKRADSIKDRYAASAFAEMQARMAICVGQLVLEEGLTPDNVANYVERELEKFEVFSRENAAPDVEARKRRRKKRD